MRADIDAALERAVSDGAVPGVVGVAGDRDGPIYAAAFGSADAEGRRPLAVDSVFRLASMTKLVTSVAAMQLVEQGRLALDAPVAATLPEFGELPVLDGFDPAPRLRPPRRAATVREVLAHTSGATYEVWNHDILRYYELTGTPSIATGRRETLRTPLACDPGERVEYGMGSDWAGLLVEAVSGQPLAEYYRQHVLDPLGLHDTTHALDAAGRARCGPVLQRTDEGFAATAIDYPAEPDFLTGGGCLYSTAPDFLRLERALLRGGELDGVRILQPATVDEMFRSQTAGRPITPLRSALGFLSLDVDLDDLGAGWSWGMGMCLNERAVPGLRSAGSGGWAGIYNSFFWIDRARGLAAGLFLQFVPFWDPAAIALLVAFERALGASVPAPA
jgi:CubicO group peptidase (beta-lactamase class C family)